MKAPVQDGALRLDGNAAAGILAEIFAADLTSARAVCSGCGATHRVGTLYLYGQHMGAVLRCPGCGSVMLRVTRTPTHAWLDASGCASIAVQTRQRT